VAPSRPPAAAARSRSRPSRSRRSASTRSSAARAAPRSSGGRGPGRGGRLGGGQLELAQRLVRRLARGRLAVGDIALQSGQERGRALLAHGDSLRRPLQPVERLDRSLALPRRVGELLLGGVPLGEEGRQLLVRAAAPERGGRLSFLRRRAPLVDRREVELRDPGPQPGDLRRQLLRPLGRRRLERERPQALSHLGLDVARALDLDRDAVQLQLGAVAPPLELPEARGLLDQLPPLLRLRREDGLDLPLADDRVHGAAEADVGEQLDEIGPPHLRLVDEVLALAAAVKAARDRDLGEVELTEAAAVVVEDELDLARVGRRPPLGAVEEHVVGLLRAQLRGRQRPGCPHDRVGDVRLAGAVRADDDRHAGLQLQLERVRERLEAA
jgi:hypothetical protein